ncbi:SCO family protein [Salinibacter sp. 10B]|uniref:SCO family protein n=1 Tax=Salinibacter sp. 10B TaxID=1923971 RepID=UPI0011AFE4F3|nr:SCO family protein [Salinibacter sp. 10B]
MMHSTRHWSWAALLLGVVLALGSMEVQAQRSNQERDQLKGVGIERQLGDSVPTDLTFRNESGETVTLGQYLDGKTPVILNLVYHDCPMLCGLMLDGFTSSLKSLEWTPGEEFRVLTVSFNHREGSEMARQKKETYVERLGRPDAAEGWHFLTGDKQTIQKLTDAVGFNFRWVEKKQEYAHPTTQIFLSGRGVVTRYIYGIEVPGGDVRKALVEASNGEVGNAIDQAAMYCFQFDPEKNTYTADAFNLMKIGSVFTVLLLGGLLFVFWRREHEELEQWEEPTAA